MLKRSLQVSLIAAAFAAGGAQASDYVMAGGAPVRTGLGECVRTGYWATPSEECEPQLAAALVKPAKAVEPEAIPVAQAKAEVPAEAKTEPPVEAKAAMPPAKEATFSTEVLFAFDSARLDDEGRKTLDRLIAKLGPDGVEKVFVTAYSDRIGASHYNLLLSERRLEAIRGYLAERGIALPQVFASAKGEEEPATKGACEKMGPENRKNGSLVECLRPDRRARVAVAGRLIRSVDAGTR